MNLVEFLAQNESRISEELRLVFLLLERPEQKVCTIEGIASSTCGAGKTCKYAFKECITDPVKDDCKYWIPIGTVEEETRKEILSNVLARRRLRTY